MSVKANMSDILKNVTGQKEPVQIFANTPLECLQKMTDRFPVLNKWLYDEPGKLKSYIWILVNDERIYEDEFDKTMQDNDRLFIMVAVVGG
ncbi:MAG: hypothetical protein R6U37_06895 [Dehalococcoidia bacterium]